MEKSLKTKSVCLIDHGNYIYLAEELVKSYGKVFLYIPQSESYLLLDKDTIGSGLKGVELIQEDLDFWKMVHSDKIDLYLFADVGFGADQYHLQWLGKRVCGSLLSGKVEVDRWFLNECVKKVGLPSVPMKKIIGTNALRDFIKKKGEHVVKFSYYRGVCETFLADDPYQLELELIDLDYDLGMNKDKIEIICQDIIESELEIGYDGYNVNGEHPFYSMLGPEIKDRAYLGKVVKDMPPLIEFVNQKMAPIFKHYGYQGPYHNELRLLAKPWKQFPVTPYYTDATCRVGSPPGEGMCRIYEDHCLARAFWDMGEGRLPILKPKDERWMAEIVLNSPKNDKRWLHLNIDPKVKEWTLLKNHCVIDKQLYVIPNKNSGYFGNVVALGKRHQDAIDLVNERVKGVKACELEVHSDIFDSATKQLKLMQKYGLLF